MMTLQLGFAKRDLTPPVGVELCGYGYYLERRNTGASDPIYARGMAYMQNDRRYLMINCDLTGVGGEYYDRIKAKLSAKLNLSTDDMLLSCIHSHTAPGLASLVGCGDVDPKYIDWAIDEIVACGCEAFCNLQPVAAVKVSSIEVPDFAFDRRGSGARICHTLNALTFSFASDRPLVLLNFGCHPVAYDISDKVSADYPGAAVAAMDELGCDAVFLNAFCGDVNPEKGSYECVQKGRIFAQYYQKSLETAEILTDLTIKTASFDKYIRLAVLTQETIDREVGYMLKVSNNSEAFQKVTKNWADINIARLAGKLPAMDLLHVRFFAIGKVLFAGFSAEMTSDLRYIITEDFFSDYIVFPMSNLFDTRRYLPTAALVEKNTYEQTSATFAYGTTPIQKGAAEQVVREACETAKKILA